jgi:hypothetical protein
MAMPHLNNKRREIYNLYLEGEIRIKDHENYFYKSKISSENQISNKR